MAQLPKIVRQRLAQQAPAGSADHPDANLLAAFAENALLERERAAVSAHLAQCADCRGSLALAIASQPEVEPAAVRATTVGKRRWLAEWRWAGVAAAACCIIAVALQYQVQSPQPPAVEKTKQLAAPPMAAAAKTGLAVVLRQQVAGARKTKVERVKPAEPVLPGPSLLAVQEQLPPPTLDTSSSAALTVRPVEPPAPPAPATTLSPPAPEAQAFRSEPAEAEQAKKGLAALQALRPRASGFAQGMVSRTQVVPARSKSALSSASVLWSINASPATAENLRGVVERSMDAGKTWEVVPLSGSVSFRAVASAGSNVWAGGTGGALFHSADAGAHWERITVSDESARLTGTIINIDAANPSLIKITTSSGERWTSPDGVRRWTRE